MTLQKQQMDLLKEQNENDKQFFPNVIKGQKEIEREERERYREFSTSQFIVSNTFYVTGFIV